MDSLVTVMDVNEMPNIQRMIKEAQQRTQARADEQVAAARQRAAAERQRAVAERQRAVAERQRADELLADRRSLHVAALLSILDGRSIRLPKATVGRLKRMECSVLPDFKAA